MPSDPSAGAGPAPRMAETFTAWLAEAARAAGFDLDNRGGVSAIATAAGLDRSMVGRILDGKTQPTIPTQMALARALHVPLRQMLIASGLVTEEDLPGPDTPPPPVPEPDLDRLAARYGIPAERVGLFKEVVDAVGERFADHPLQEDLMNTDPGTCS